MRVLFVTNMYPPHHYGGYELSCADAVRRFRQAGHVVSVLTSNIEVAGVTGTDPDDAVWRTLEMYWNDHVLLSPTLKQRYTQEKRNATALESALEVARPDLVSVWNMGALSLGLLTLLAERSIPTVFVLADNWPCYAPKLDAWSRLFDRFPGSTMARSVGRATSLPTKRRDFSTMGACLFYSRHTLEAVRSCSDWTMPIAGVVYSGVETAEFPIADSEVAVAERPWSGQLLYVGRIDERKGIDTSIRALAMLPDSRLRVVGRGDEAYLAQLKDLVRSTGVESRVEFDVRERGELVQEYRSADVLIFPSVYEEPFGIVPLEAMACDTPVVGTGRGGSGEYLDHEGNCLIFPAGNATELAAAVRRLAGDATLRNRLIRGGRHTARSLTTEIWARTLLEWHEAAQSRSETEWPESRVISPPPRLEG